MYIITFEKYVQEIVLDLHLIQTVRIKLMLHSLFPGFTLYTFVKSSGDGGKLRSNYSSYLQSLLKEYANALQRVQLDCI
jgi:hypothetical protein